MVKINREYLDPALAMINEHTATLVDRSRSRQGALKATAQAIADRARAELVFRTNLSRGIMVGIILVAIGLMLYFAAGPMSRLIYGSSITHGSSPIIPEPTSPIISGSDVTITQSVTLFNTVTEIGNGSPFTEVVAGHVFERVQDQRWANAYCYAEMPEGTNFITVSLSTRTDYSAPSVLKPYEPNSRYSEQHFRTAQRLCPYQISNF